MGNHCSGANAPDDDSSSGSGGNNNNNTNNRMTQSWRKQHREHKKWNDLEMVLVASRGELELLRTMVNEGGNVNAMQQSRSRVLGHTPLSSACLFGHYETFALLLEHGADIHVKDPRNGYTAFFYAIVGHHPDIVQRLIQEGADLHTPCLQLKKTPLHEATRRPGSSLRIARMLLEEPQRQKHEKRRSFLDVNAADVDGKTPLFAPCLHGHLEMVKLLILHGADPSIVANDGSTPLCEAFQSGNTALIEWLLNLEHRKDCEVALPDHDYGENHPLKPSESATTALSYRLKSPLNVNLRLESMWWSDGETQTPLHWVLTRHRLHDATRLRLATRLLQLGASVHSTTDLDLCTPLHEACKLLTLQQQEQQQQQQQRPEKQTPDALEKEDSSSSTTTTTTTADSSEASTGAAAAASVCLEMVHYLLDRGANVHAMDRHGWTPLFVAAATAVPTTAAAVAISDGNKINSAFQQDSQRLSSSASLENIYCQDEKKDSSEDEAYSSFAAGMNTACFRSKKNHGASSIRTTVNQNMSPTEQVVQCLLEHGANVTARDIYGRTPLHEAAAAASLAATVTTVATTTSVITPSTSSSATSGSASQRTQQQEQEKNCSRPRGRRRRPCCYWYQDPGVVRQLLAHGASVHALDYNDRTPLFGAARFGHVGVVALLLQHGAHVHLVDRTGATPFHMALQGGSMEVIQILVLELVHMMHQPSSVSKRHEN